MLLGTFTFRFERPNQQNIPAIREKEVNRFKLELLQLGNREHMYNMEIASMLCVKKIYRLHQGKLTIKLELDAFIYM